MPAVVETNESDVVLVRSRFAYVSTTTARGFDARESFARRRWRRRSRRDLAMAGRPTVAAAPLLSVLLQYPHKMTWRSENVVNDET